MLYLKLLMVLTTINMHMERQTTTDMEQYVIGEWEWIETQLVARGGGSTTTPESCKCTRTLRLDADGSMKQFENGALKVETSFTIEAIQFLNDPIRYQFSSEPMFGSIHKIDEDKLGVGAFGSCGFVHYYKRIKGSK